MKIFLVILAKLLLLKLLLAIIVICIPILTLSYIVGRFNRYWGVKIATLSSFLIWTNFDWIFRVSCEVEAPDIKKDNYLVVSNHASASDFMLINRVNKDMLQHSKYAFKKNLKYIPLFYQGFILLNFLSLARKFELDRKIIEDYIEDLKREQYPIWFVLFCEGARFTERTRQASQEFCKEKEIRPFKNVLVPRYKGFSIFQDGLRNSYIKKVLDLTFYCDDNTFSLFNCLFTTKEYRFKCDARIIDLEDIKDPSVFIEEAFRRKDELIESWKSNLKHE